MESPITLAQIESIAPAPPELGGKPAVIYIEQQNGPPIQVGADTGMLVKIKSGVTFAGARAAAYVIGPYSERRPKMEANLPGRDGEWQLVQASPTELQNGQFRNFYAYAVDITKPWPYPRYAIDQVLFSGGVFSGLLMIP